MICFKRKQNSEINKEVKYLEKNSKNNHLYNMVLTSIFMSMTLLTSYLSSLLKLPIVSGYSIPFELVIYVFAIVFIKKIYFKLFYFIVTPLIALSFGGSYLNVLQTFCEYVLIYYVFFLFFFIDFSNTENSKKKKIITFILFVIFLVISCVLKFIVHLLAGVIWWTPSNPSILGNIKDLGVITSEQWTTSAVLNAQYVFVGMGIYLPIVIIVYWPLYSLYNNIKY